MYKESAVIVVGAGPAGLAAAACLNHQSMPTLVLEREDIYAPIWTKYSYDRLHLHLPKEACELPLMEFPPSYPRYVPKKLFLHYLKDYVSRFNINPLYRRSVKSAFFHDGEKKWVVKVKNLGSHGGGDGGDSEEEEEEYRARFLVVATGETSDAWVPEVEGLSSFNGEAFHSIKYKSGDGYRDKRVLVVGAGNSGMEIAFDLAEHGANTSIVVRSPIHILSREMMASVKFLFKCRISFNAIDKIMTMLSKLFYGDLSKYGIQRPPEGPFLTKIKYNRYPIIDVGTCKKIKSGEIKVLPAIASVKGNDVIFENGEKHSFDTIIFATGFRTSTNKWLKEEWDDRLFNEKGFSRQNFPNNWKGKNGLYCVGLSGRGLRGIQNEALSVANDVKDLL